MQNTITKSGVEAYIRANWFKLLMIGMVLFVFLRKDLSFSFNLNSPVYQEEEQMPLKEEVHFKKPDKKQQISKKNDIAKAGSSGTSLFDLVDIPFIGKGNVKKVAAQEIQALDEGTKKSFVDRFAHVAINERKKFGIPSSVILANAILQGVAGQRDMAIQGNNYFGLPCVAAWKGDSGTYNDACYRHYENAWASFRDHSLYISTGVNQSLLKHGPSNYKAWAKGLEQSGTFEIDNLAAKLISIIEKNDLTVYDRL